MDTYTEIKLGHIKVGGSRHYPLEHRFWKRVNKDGPIHPTYGQCWAWLGKARLGVSYGTIYTNGKNLYVHRYSWQLHYGEIPSSMCVLHRCDNTLCVNPQHLFIGNDTDNMADRDSKCRQAKGEHNGWAKITDEQVVEIRRRHIPYCNVNGTKALAREFGVTRKTIKDIVHGRSWKHIS